MINLGETGNGTLLSVLFDAWLNVHAELLVPNMMLFNNNLSSLLNNNLSVLLNNNMSLIANFPQAQLLSLIQPLIKRPYLPLIPKNLFRQLLLPFQELLLLLF